MPRGGARVGAGRPKGGGKPKTIPPVSQSAESVRAGDDGPAIGQTPLEYMLAVMNDAGADQSRRDRLAVAAAPYLHPKQADGNKKDDRKKAAGDAAAGKFAPAAPPKLSVVNSR